MFLKSTKKKTKKTEIVKKKKKNDDELTDNEERITEIADISKERVRKGSDFSFDPVTKRLMDMTNIINKSFVDIKKIVT